jgi:hypothetical protein
LNKYLWIGTTFFEHSKIKIDINFEQGQYDHSTIESDEWQKSFICNMFYFYLSKRINWKDIGDRSHEQYMMTIKEKEFDAFSGWKKYYVITSAINRFFFLSRISSRIWNSLISIYIYENPLDKQNRFSFLEGIISWNRTIYKR